MSARPLLLLVCLAGVAHAQPDPKALMAEGEFEQAIEALDRQLASATTEEQRAGLELQRATCFLALRNEPQTRAALASAVTRWPELALPEKGANPELKRLLEVTREQLSSELSLTTDPPGAEIYVDDRPVGLSPLRLVLPAGKHDVRAVSLGQELAARAAAIVRPNRREDLKLTLLAAHGSVDMLLKEPAPERPDPWQRRTASIGLAVGGAAVLGVSLAGALYSLQVNDAFQRQQDPTRYAATVTHAEAQVAQTLWPLSLTGIAIGIVALAAAPFVWPRDITVGLTPLADGAAASIALRL